MKRLITIFISILFFLSFNSLYSQPLKVITIDNYIINPVISQYIIREITKAEKNNEIVIIKLDTPGGLLNPTQEIVKKILNANVPIITYISPQGARAASAGVFISMSSHILAMAPSTHIGAAHPIIGQNSWGNLSEEIKEKILNDITSWAENIAERRGRSKRFIIEAIKESVSITEKSALKQKVCDLIASDLNELISQLNGKEITIKNKKITLLTTHQPIIYTHLTPQEKFLNALIDPNIVYILMLLGILGLIYEVTHPGFGFPGIAGVICLLFTFYSLSILPINYTGLLFIIIGIIFLLVEVFTPGIGIFALGGIISLIIGSLMLFNQKILHISLWTIISITTILFIFIVIILRSIIKTQPTYTNL